MEHEAIYQLYTNVKSIKEDAEIFTAYDKDSNEVSIDMSAVNTKANELQAEADAEVQAKIDNKASAKAKLIAGQPLTEAEADTLII